MLLKNTQWTAVVPHRRRLDSLLAATPVTLVVGDSGAGKTTAVVSWVNTVGFACVWVDAHAHRQDIWGAVSARLHAEGLIPGADPRRGVSLREEIRLRLMSATTPFTIVIDDADGLHPDVVDELVDLAVGSRSMLRLVVISRLIPAAATVHDPARPIAIVTAEHLALTFCEVDDLLETVGVSASMSAASFLHAVTGGLPLLVAVVARALGGQRVHGERPSALQAQRAVDAVERVAIPHDREAPPAELLGRIRAAALLIDLTVAELMRLIEAPEGCARDTLESAKLAGWGRWSDDDRLHFSFTPTVARALAFRLRVKRSKPLLSRAASILSDRGDGARAIMFAFDAEDDELILRVGAKHMGVLLSHHRQVLARLQRIPSLRLVEHPLVALITAACQAHDPRNHVASIGSWLRAERLSRAGAVGGRAVDRIVILTGRSVAFGALGRHSSSAEAAESAVRLLEELPLEDVAQLLVSPGMVYGQTASAHFATGDIRSARSASARAVGMPASFATMRRNEWGKSALFAAVDGDITAARADLDAARRQSGADEFFLGAFVELAAALIAVEDGEPATARRIVQETRTGVRTDSLWPIAESTLALADLLDGHAAEAVLRLKRAIAARATAPPSPSERSALVALLALALLATGDMAEVRLLLNSVGRDGGAFVARAAVALASGDEMGALIESTTGLSAVRTIRVRATLLLLRAAAASRLGRSAAADRDASAAFVCMHEHGVWTPWLVLQNDDREAIIGRVERRGLVSPATWSRLRAMSPVLPRICGVPRLTGREHAVLVGVFARETNADIAVRLGISPNTVKKQRASLYRKLDVRTWEEAIQAAVDHGLLDAHP